MTQGIFFEPGEGMALSARGSLMLFKAVAETTDGAFSLMERTLPVSNRRPQPHTHEGPEGFYVLEGQIEFVVGGESRVGGPGFWALVPSGVSPGSEAWARGDCAWERATLYSGEAGGLDGIHKSITVGGGSGVVVRVASARASCFFRGV